MDLHALPKVELHRHLEGAIRLSTLLELYRAAGDPLPAESPEELAPLAQVLEPMGSLEEVLGKFGIAQGAFHTPEATERIAYEAVGDLAADNVRLAELRFSPDFMCRPAGLDWDAAMEAVAAGVDRARGEHDVAVGLIAIASRDLGLESARRTVDFALRHRDDLVGFDLAGDERDWPPHLYADLLAPLRDAELPLTLHYGESGPPDYPRLAVELLGARRLGHGVSVARDPRVTALMAERGVVLEMCPTSNVRTHAVRSLAEHPARRLLDEGVRVTINTDDPGLFGIDLTGELEVARDALGFGDDHVGAVTAHALDASFLDDGTKADARARHFGWLAESRPGRQPGS